MPRNRVLELEEILSRLGGSPPTSLVAFKRSRRTGQVTQLADEATLEEFERIAERAALEQAENDASDIVGIDSRIMRDLEALTQELKRRRVA